MKYLFLVFITLSLSYSQNLIKNGSYVIDKKLYLSWQDTRENVNIRHSYDGALKYCQDLRLGDYDNWELPSRKQYKTIIDMSRKDELMISRQFKYIMPVDYWTQDTRWQSLNRYAYYVFFKSGSIYFNNKSHEKFVRCVRKMNK
ncbi:MAG TPA: DUF1566 domain-containing protein [Arcobacter sp.]|nr:DUF1566 domain-containing protein [Arcobacter sp.]HIP56094.1 DUF1566 domain-containing protein [Arcobacter sp.]